MGITTKLYIYKQKNSLKPFLYIPVGVLRYLGFEVKKGKYKVEIEIDEENQQIIVKL